jgi:hypothetical protein
VSDIVTRLWERAEAAIERVALDEGLALAPVRRMAREATVALLHELDAEIGQANEDGADWPDYGDFGLLADDLEGREVAS